MDKNWHRKLFMKLLLRSMPYKVFRSPGIIFNSHNKSYDKYLKLGIRLYLKSTDSDRASGAIGCWIAHSKVLEEVTEQNGITVVLEDDFICRSKFFENALKMVNAFDRDFDVIIFDAWGSGPLEIDKISNNIYRSGCYSYPYYGGTHCLFVNNASIPKILDAKLNSQVMDYDGFLYVNGKINSYIFYTGECASRGIGSDISLKDKLKYDISGILVCLLSNNLRDRTTKFRSYFGKWEEKKSLQFSEEKLKCFEGYYRAQESGKVDIEFAVKEGQLALLQPLGGQDILYQPISEVDFVSKKAPLPLKFIKDENDEVTAVLINNNNTFRKDKNYEVCSETIAISSGTLKTYEGKYYFQHGNNFIIQIIAMADHLMIKRSWNGVESDLLPRSELEFFAKAIPSSIFRFIKDNDGAIVQINVSNSIFIKSKDPDAKQECDEKTLLD